MTEREPVVARVETTNDFERERGWRSWVKVTRREDTVNIVYESLGALSGDVLEFPDGIEVTTKHLDALIAALHAVRDRSNEHG